MISAIHTALSGLTAFAKQLDVSAHNLANLNTDGFKRSDTIFVEAANGGTFPVIRKDDSAGPTVLRNTSHGFTQVERSNVDIATELVDQIIARRGFEANLRAVNTADDLLGTLLDLTQ